MNYKKEIEYLREQSIKYYTNGISDISDKEYDIRIRNLIDFESKHPNEISPESPTQNVEYVVNKNNRLTHGYPMYSMKDAFTESEVKKWLRIVMCEYFILMPKFDGASMNLVYENGNLVFGITRGDGMEGENITTKAEFIQGIPKTISIPGRVEIRGEVVMDRKTLKELNDMGYSYKNARNAVSGSLNLNDLKEFKKRKLMFLPWGLEGVDVGTHEEALDMVWNEGFKRYDKLIVSTLEEIEERFNYYNTRQEHFKVDYDGLAIRVNDNQEYEELGTSGKYPKGILAYKYDTVEKETVVKEIIVQIGRTGVITPVAVIEPVELDGATVTRAILHNWGHIEELGINIGDTVAITRSGGVIPKILRVTNSVSEESYPRPNKCPICKHNLIIANKQIFCNNPDCKGRNVHKIIFFSDREQMDISGLGETLLNVLFENGIITKLTDFYTIDAGDLEPFTGEKNATTIMKNIEASKGKELWKLLGAMGGSKLGRRTWKKILKYNPDIFDISIRDLEEIPGIGKEIAASCVNFLATRKKEIKELISLTEAVNTEVVNTEYKDRVYYITGSLDRPRRELVKEIESKGGSVSTTLNKNITHFIAGKNAPKHKVDKAKELGLI